MPVSSVSLKTTKKTYFGNQLQSKERDNGGVRLDPADSCQPKKKTTTNMVALAIGVTAAAFTLNAYGVEGKEMWNSPGTAKTRGILSITETRFSSGSITARRKDFIRRRGGSSWPAGQGVLCMRCYLPELTTRLRHLIRSI